MRNVKLEKGTKATAWSPAPEDLLTDAEAAQTYSTKSYVDQTARTVSLGVVEEYKNGQHGSALATQSDITAAKDSITSTVSQTYATKTEFDNLQVGGTNLFVIGTSKDGFRISADGGEFSDSEYTISDYISVQPNEKYILTAYVNGSGNASDDYVSIARYRSDKSFIDRPIFDADSFEYGDSWAITATSETAYVRLSFPTSGKGKFKFERGTKSTDWSPAPEDIDESFADLADIVNANNANTASLIQSSIEQTKDSIISQVEASYYTKTEAEELMTQMSTQFQQTENSFEMQFNALRTIVDQVNESADTNYSNIQKYIRFVDGHIIIGVEGNPFSLDIGNDRISFMQNNSEIAYISNHEFYITSGIITQNLRIGNFEFRPRSNGNLSLSLAGI